MKDLALNIKVVEIENHGATELQEVSNWYFYKAKKNEEIIKSFIICQQELSQNDIRLLIQEKIKSTKFINLSKVSKNLKSLIENCHSSENEMWFVGTDDIEWTVQMIDIVRKEVLKLGINNYIRFGEDGYLITVYGGISEIINFDTEN